MTADRPEKTETERPLYWDEAIRLLPLKEFARREHTFPRRRLPLHSPAPRRS